MLDQVSYKESQERNRWKIMIIGYDRNPALTEDQKLQSLIDSIQRALDEMKEEIEMLKAEIAERME